MSETLRSDLLIQKVFRAIDAVELERPGTLIDAVSRAEKRGLVPGVDEIRKMRETRDEIAHEYVIEDLTDLLDRVQGHMPVPSKTTTIIKSPSKYKTKQHLGFLQTYPLMPHNAPMRQ